MFRGGSGHDGPCVCGQDCIQTRLARLSEWPYVCILCLHTLSSSE